MQEHNYTITMKYYNNSYQLIFCWKRHPTPANPLLFYTKKANKMQDGKTTGKLKDRLSPVSLSLYHRTRFWGFSKCQCEVKLEFSETTFILVSPENRTWNSTIFYMIFLTAPIIAYPCGTSNHIQFRRSPVNANQQRRGYRSTITLLWSIIPSNNRCHEQQPIKTNITNQQKSKTP